MEVVEGSVGQFKGVCRGFNDHLVSPDSIHSVVSTEASAIKIPLNSKSGKFIGNDAHFPSRMIRGGSVPDSRYFRRRPSFVPFAKRADPPGRLGFAAGKIIGTSPPFSGDNNPSSLDGVVAQFRHRIFDF